MTPKKATPMDIHQVTTSKSDDQFPTPPRGDLEEVTGPQRLLERNLDACLPHLSIRTGVVWTAPNVQQGLFNHALKHHIHILRLTLTLLPKHNLPQHLIDADIARGELEKQEALFRSFASGGVVSKFSTESLVGKKKKKKGSLRKGRRREEIREDWGEWKREAEKRETKGVWDVVDDTEKGIGGVS